MIIYLPLALFLIFIAGAIVFNKKFIALGLLVLSIPVLFFITISGLSNPKPYEWEYMKEDAKVLSAAYKTDEEIYLWVAIGDRPVYYSLPWSDKAADKLQRAMREAEENGTDVMMKWERYDGEDYPEPIFYATEIEQLPEKQ